MEEHEILKTISVETGLVRTGRGEISRAWLIQKLNELIESDFARVVQILYRVDVNEQKLKKLLQQHPERDAGEIMADLLIERQNQKKNNKEGANERGEIPDEEKW
jgi:hypothetical protein